MMKAMIPTVSPLSSGLDVARPERAYNARAPILVSAEYVDDQQHTESRDRSPQDQGQIRDVTRCLPPGRLLPSLHQPCNDVGAARVTHRARVTVIVFTPDTVGLATRRR
jgi:hypothetical protein